MSKALILIGRSARNKFEGGGGVFRTYKEIKLAWQVGTDSAGRLSMRRIHILYRVIDLGFFPRTPLLSFYYTVVI